MTRIPKQCPPSPCLCGSGKPKSAPYDARGIFLTYTCEDCHARKMAGYRPDVLTDPAYWTDEPIEPDMPAGQPTCSVEVASRATPDLSA
jgi:hypothetical protein